MPERLNNSVLNLIKDDEVEGEKLESKIRDLAIEKQNNSSDGKNLHSRRDFLKKTLGGLAGLGAAAMIPNVSGFEIRSDSSIDFSSLKGERKFRYTSDGKLNIGRIGSSSNPVKNINVKELNNDSNSAKITVYEDKSGKAKAVTENKTFNSGKGIFDAAQQAINAQLSKNVETARGKKGNIDVFIKPGYYQVSNTISITDKGAERVSISSRKMYGATIDTSDTPENKPVIEINPNAENNFRDRIFWANITGLRIQDENAYEGVITESHSRKKDGIVINDVSHLNIECCDLRGYERALWLRNIWQGKVDHMYINRSGLNRKEDNGPKPCVQLGHPNDTDTSEALNHVQFNHLQGGPPGAGLHHAFLQTFGKCTRIDINFPNIELDNNPGFIFNGGVPQHNIIFRGASLTGGAPAIEMRGSTVLNMSNCNIDADTEVIQAIDFSRLTLTGSLLRNSHDNTGEMMNVVDFEGFRINASNCFIDGGKRGIKIHDGTLVDISSILFRGANYAALKCTGTRRIHISDISALESASEGENPVYIDNADDSYIGDILGQSPRGIPAVRIGGCENSALGKFIPIGNCTKGLVNDYGSSFREWRGEATIVSGNTRVSVNHQLSDTPDLSGIQVTPQESKGQASEYWIENSGDKQFDIVVDSDPNKDISFSWKAELQ